MSEHIEWIEVIKTRPMSLNELATWFDSSPRRVGSFINSIDGVEKINNRFRVPVRSMPPEFLLHIGLIEPATDDRGSHLGHTGDSSPTTTSEADTTDA